MKGMSLPVMLAHLGRDAAIASLSELLGDRLSTDELVRRQHGRGGSYHPSVPPEAVAFAQSTEEVSAIVILLAEHGEAVSVMRAIKQAIDPDNIMNPVKILEV